MVKKVILIILALLMCFTYITNVKACDDIIESADNFINLGSDSENTLNYSVLKEGSDLLYNILLTIGIVIAVIIGAVIGIQFMVGSIEQKAKIKETLIPYIAGCVVIFGAFGIWKLVVTILNNT